MFYGNNSVKVGKRVFQLAEFGKSLEGVGMSLLNLERCSKTWMFLN
jgi:hypothetical protein